MEEKSVTQERLSIEERQIALHLKESLEFLTRSSTMTTEYCRLMLQYFTSINEQLDGWINVISSDKSTALLERIFPVLSSNIKNLLTGLTNLQTVQQKWQNLSAVQSPLYLLLQNLSSKLNNCMPWFGQASP